MKIFPLAVLSLCCCTASAETVFIDFEEYTDLVNYGDALYSSETLPLSSGFNLSVSTGSLIWLNDQGAGSRFAALAWSESTTATFSRVDNSAFSMVGFDY
jgi:hypothetical protein